MLLPTLWPCYIAPTCQRYYEVNTLAFDCLSNPHQTVCAYVWRSQRSFVSNGHNNTDLVIARTSSASLSNHDRIRHPSHQNKIWRQSFLCCWTSRMEHSARRYMEHYRLVILQTSHQDTLFCIGIFGLHSFTFPDCTIFDASGQFF